MNINIFRHPSNRRPPLVKYRNWASTQRRWAQHRQRASRHHFNIDNETLILKLLDFIILNLRIYFPNTQSQKICFFYNYKYPAQHQLVLNMNEACFEIKKPCGIWLSIGTEPWLSVGGRNIVNVYQDITSTLTMEGYNL